MGSWTGPNDSLSSLLPSAPTSYAGTLGGPTHVKSKVPGWAKVAFPISNLFGGSREKGISSSSKLQYQADILGKSGTDTIGAGTSLLGQPLDYWQKLLQPPTRQGLLERQGPAVSSVVGQYSTGKQALERLPRGGGTSATLANLPFQEAGDITGLIEKELSQYQNVLQPEAAQAITGIAQSLSSLGLAEMGLSTQGLVSLIGSAAAKGDKNKQLAGDTGKAIGQMLAMLLV